MGMIGMTTQPRTCFNVTVEVLYADVCRYLCDQNAGTNVVYPWFFGTHETSRTQHARWTDLMANLRCQMGLCYFVFESRKSLMWKWWGAPPRDNSDHKWRSLVMDTMHADRMDACCHLVAPDQQWCRFCWYSDVLQQIRVLAFRVNSMFRAYHIVSPQRSWSDRYKVWSADACSRQAHRTYRLGAPRCVLKGCVHLIPLVARRLEKQKTTRRAAFL